MAKQVAQQHHFVELRRLKGCRPGIATNECDRDMALGRPPAGELNQALGGVECRYPVECPASQGDSAGAISATQIQQTRAFLVGAIAQQLARIR